MTESIDQPSPQFRQLATEYAGISLHRQLGLIEVGIGDYGRWDLDLAAGKLMFSDDPKGRPDLTVKVELLGSEAEQAATWLWIWGNEAMASQLPPEVMAAANKMREHGEQHGVPELSEREWPLDLVDGQQLAAITAGVLGCPGYYRGPYDGGAAILLIVDDQLPDHDESPIARVPHAFTAAIQVFGLDDHRAALRRYAEKIGLTVQPSGDAMELIAPTGQALLAEFDDLHRLTSISGEV